MGAWIQVWSPCQNSDHFTIDAKVPSFKYIIDNDPSNWIKTPAYTLNIVRHQDICGLQYEAAGPGRCSRAVIAGVGELIVAKLMVTAFIAPAVSLLLSFPVLVRAYERVVQVFKPDYKKQASLDVELATAINALLPA